MFHSSATQSANSSGGHACALHRQHFALVFDSFLRCTLNDQVRLFRYVDKFAPSNHMLYFLMKEAMTTMNRTRHKSTHGDDNLNGDSRDGKKKRRNVQVYDGLERRLASVAATANNQPMGLTATAEAIVNEEGWPSSSSKAIVVQSTRDYTLVLNNLLPGMVPRDSITSVRSSRIRVAVDEDELDEVINLNDITGRKNRNDANRLNNMNSLNGLNSLNSLRGTRNDDEDDDEEESSSDDDEENAPGGREKRRERNGKPGKSGKSGSGTGSRSKSSSKSNSNLGQNMMSSGLGSNSKKASRKRTLDGESDKNDSSGRTRNNYKLFSKSPRSIWVMYEQAFKKFSQFSGACSSEWRLDKHHERLSMRHTTFQLVANNMGALLSTSFALSEAPSGGSGGGSSFGVPSATTDVIASSSRIIRLNKLITASPESAILNPDCSWNVNSVFTIDMPIIEQQTQQASELTTDTRELVTRLVELRQRVKKFVSETEPNSDPYEGTADDEHLVQKLNRLAHLDRKPNEFRVAHEQEYSLVHLRNMTEHCIHLAHVNLMHILDFVFFSEFDAWEFFNAVLEYGIRSFRENGVYPVKHALWDIVMIQRTSHRLATRLTDALALSNYRIAWLYSNTTVVGGLTQFAQSFRHILRTGLCTSCSYFLNRKVMNTRKNGQRHDCLMPKTSQGTYYAMFLRLQAGHELVCIDRIENDTEAIQWLQKYDNINNHLWRKRRITRCHLLADHLNEAMEDTRGGGDGLRMTEQPASRSNDFTRILSGSAVGNSNRVRFTATDESGGQRVGNNRGADESNREKRPRYASSTDVIPRGSTLTQNDFLDETNSNDEDSSEDDDISLLDYNFEDE